MVDKPPPRFAPEGARFKRPDWAPEGSQADQQKRTYVDRIGDLEGQIKALQADVEGRDAEIIDLQKRLGELARELGRAEGQNDKLTADLHAFHQDREGDMGRIDDGQASIAALTNERDAAQRALNALQHKHDELIALEAKQTTALSRERKIADRNNTKLIAVAILGLAGTIWGSLGNPVPWSSSKSAEAIKPPKTEDEIAAERLLQQRTACVLKERTRSVNRTAPVVHGLPWLPGDPPVVVQTKDVSSPPQIKDIRVTGVSIDRPYSGSNRMTITGKITNSGASTVSAISANLFLMGTLENGECQPLYSQGVYADFYVSPGSSKDFSISIDVPNGTSSFSGGNGYLTDLKLSFY